MTEISIRRMDWRRIYRKVNGVPRESSLYSVLASVLLGTGATTLVSLIPLYPVTASLAPWVIPTYWAVGISSIALAAAMFVFDRQRRKQIESSCEEVLRDMSDINACYFPDETLGREVMLPPQSGSKGTLTTWTFWRRRG